jgi:hypothetical protein
MAKPFRGTKGLKTLRTSNQTYHVFLGFDFMLSKTKPKSSHTIKVFFHQHECHSSLQVLKVSSLPHSLIVWFLGNSKMMDV